MFLSADKDTIFFLIKHFFCTFFVENQAKYLLFSIKVLRFRVSIFQYVSVFRFFAVRLSVFVVKRGNGIKV